MKTGLSNSSGYFIQRRSLAAFLLATLAYITPFGAYAQASASVINIDGGAVVAMIAAQQAAKATSLTRNDLPANWNGQINAATLSSIPSASQVNAVTGATVQFSVSPWLDETGFKADAPWVPPLPPNTNYVSSGNYDINVYRFTLSIQQQSADGSWSDIPKGHQINGPLLSEDIAEAVGADYNPADFVDNPVIGNINSALDLVTGQQYTMPSNKLLLRPIFATVTLTQSVTVIRLKITFDWGPVGVFSSAGQKYYDLNFNVPADANGYVLTGSWNVLTQVRYSAPFTLVLVPAGFAQSPVIPFAILYNPPGNQSYANIELSDQFSTRTTLTTTDGSKVESTNGYSKSIGLTLSGSSLSAVISPFIPVAAASAKSALGAIGGLPVSYSVSSSWQDSETRTTQSSNQYQTSSGMGIGEKQAFQVGPSPQAKPIPGWSLEDEPFWSDQIIVLVRPNLAVWDMANSFQFSVQAYQEMWPLSVRQLSLAVSSGKSLEIDTPTTPVYLSPEDCLDLLMLDPFWVAGTQGATPPNGVLLTAGVLQTDYTYLIESDKYASSGSASQSSEITASSVSAVAVSSSVTTIMGYSTSSQKTNGTSQTATVETSAQDASTYQSTWTETGVLQDSNLHGTEYEVSIYRDCFYGGLMFQVNAPLPKPTPQGLNYRYKGPALSTLHKPVPKWFKSFDPTLFAKEQGILHPPSPPALVPSASR